MRIGKEGKNIKSIIINKKDSIHYDQVHGKKIDGIFENNELKILYVDKDGEAIYFTEDEKDSTINEINTIYCESMTILLKNNNIEKILNKPKHFTKNKYVLKRSKPLNKSKYTTFNKLGQWPQTNENFWWNDFIHLEK